MVLTAFIASLISFIVTLILSRTIIYLMDSRGIGQYIRSWGPKVHEHKSGTPTMGGLAILGGIGSTLLFLWFYSPQGRNYLLLLLLGTFGFGVIGCIDDVLSILRSRAKGLSPSGKLLAQLSIGLLLVFLSFRLISEPNSLILPFSSLIVGIPTVLYYLLTLFVLVSITNAVNLTDGLDGLAAGASLISALAFLGISGATEIPIFAGLIGAILGFIWYNFYPAQLFMGDTGAFALGGFLGTAAIITRGELFLPLFGGLFVAEALSVILQIVYYKLTGNRIFKISPLHHHFESADGIDYGYILPGFEWKEPKITARLLIAHLILAGVGLLGYFGWIA